MELPHLRDLLKVERARQSALCGLSLLTEVLASDQFAEGVKAIDSGLGLMMDAAWAAFVEWTTPTSSTVENSEPLEPMFLRKYRKR